jgi:hypothetical protein
VLHSNLGLTVFVKHQVNWLNRFRSLPSGKGKKKQLKGRDLIVFSVFAPTTAKVFRHSFSFHRKYMPHRIYRGTKAYFIRSPHPCLCRGPPSGHASPLGYFDRVIFNYKPSAGRREPGTWDAGQTGKPK